MEYHFDTTGLCSAEIDHFHEAHTILKDRFNVEPTGEIDFHLEDFEIFKNYIATNVRDSFVVKHTNNNSYILFVQSQLVNLGKGAKAGTTDCQIWALAYLKHNFGRVLIRRETFTDKIIELIHPIELDFKEDKPFSDTFYVVANDVNKALAGITRNFRNAVMDVRTDNLVIEIFEHTLIIGNTKPISAEKVIHLAEFVSRLCATCE